MNLGTASTYAVLAGTDVENTGATRLEGDLGLSPSGTITGFGPGLGTVTGAIHDKDTAASDAQRDRLAAYSDAAGRPGGQPFAGDQIGKRFEAGLYSTSGVFLNTGTMTLDGGGNASSVFIFQVNAAFSPAAASNVVLTGGAQASNVFWQINGAVTIPAGSSYAGVFLVNGAATIGEGANLPGRVLVNGKVTLANNRITTPTPGDSTPPLISITGGASVTTDDSTPTISGTTDEPVGRTVTVTVGSQTLTTQVTAGGNWQVTATTLADGSYTVRAQVTDAAGNTGTATQSLTVASARFIAIDGGPSRTTNDTTPRISGTTSEAAGSTVAVTVDGQNLVATVTAGGSWSVVAAVLSDGVYDVHASVAGGPGVTYVDDQVLTITSQTPARFIAIDGGPSRTTNDTTPTISGTTSEAAGSTVAVTVDGQNLVATVTAGGSWSVVAAVLSDGVYDVVASVVGGDGNTYTAAQTLTVSGSTTSEPRRRFRPDAAIKQPGKRLVGVGIYGGSVGQQVTTTLRRKARVATFVVRVQNRGRATDRIKIGGTARQPNFKLTYWRGTTNVSKAVKRGRYLTPPLAPRKSVRLTIKVKRTKSARPGDRAVTYIRTNSTRSTRSDKRDVVRAAVRIP